MRNYTTTIGQAFCPAKPLRKAFQRVMASGERANAVTFVVAFRSRTGTLSADPYFVRNMQEAGFIHQGGASLHFEASAQTLNRFFGVPGPAPRFVASLVEMRGAGVIAKAPAAAVA